MHNRNQTLFILDELRNSRLFSFAETFQSADPYVVLGIQPDASRREISRAYRRLALAVHPDKNLGETRQAHLLFVILLNAYERAIKQAQNNLRNDSAAPNLRRYINQVSFINLINVHEIEAEDLLVLDGYAFSALELSQKAERSLIDFYRNPYVSTGARSRDFSPEAQQMLNQHPLLSSFARQFAEHLSLQANHLHGKTIDEVIKMLTRFNLEGVAGSADARAEFLEHKATLAEEDQQHLDNYFIRLPHVEGGTHNMLFKDAFLGGQYSQCIVIAQMFLWQFVVDLRPGEIEHIPEAVWAQLQRAELRIQVKEPQVSQVEELGSVNAPRF